MSSLFVLKNGRALIESQLIEKNIYYKDGIIIDEQSICSDDEVFEIDCSGKIVCPGFIDVQHNGSFGCDFSTSNNITEHIKIVCEKITSTGCTSYCPTIITSKPEDYKKRIPNITINNNKCGTGANVLGVHLEGPFISKNKRGCHPIDLIRSIPKLNNQSEAEAFIKSIYGEDLSNIVIVTLAAEYAGSSELTKYLVNQGIIVNVGHSESTYDEAMSCIRCGASGITHLFSAMNFFKLDEPHIIGIITNYEKNINRKTKLPQLLKGYALNNTNLTARNSRLYYGLIADCVHTDPTTLSFSYKVNKDGLCLVTDAMSALGLDDGTYNIGQTKVSVGGNPRKALKYGTDTLAGVIAPINECIKNFISATHCTLEFALQAASLHPAEYLGITDTKGKLKNGMDADIIVIDNELNVYRTIVNGKEVYRKNTI